MRNCFSMMWAEASLTVTQLIETGYHKHDCIQAVFSIDAIFDLYIEDKECLKSLSFAIIPRHISHKILLNENSGGKLVCIFSYHRVDEFLIDFYHAESIKHFKSRPVEMEPILSLIELEEYVKARDLMSKFLQKNNYIAKSPLDIRIGKVLRSIQDNIDKQPNLNELTEIAELSKSRLQHLFADQIGQSISKYSLSFRMRIVFEALSRGVPVQQAALEAGFTDYPHFSKNFKKQFGVPPKGVFSKDLGIKFIADYGFVKI